MMGAATLTDNACICCRLCRSSDQEGQGEEQPECVCTGQLPASSAEGLPCASRRDALVLGTTCISGVCLAISARQPHDAWLCVDAMQIALVLIDEVHLLNEAGRGSSLEAGCICRLKALATSKELAQVCAGYALGAVEHLRMLKFDLRTAACCLQAPLSTVRFVAVSGARHSSGINSSSHQAGLYLC